MFISIAIRHTTDYQFKLPTSLGPHPVCLRPATRSRTWPASPAARGYADKTAFAHPDALKNELTPYIEAEPPLAKHPCKLNH